MGTSQGQPIILVKIVCAPALEPSLLYMALILLAFQRELSRFSVEKKNVASDGVISSSSI